MSREIESVAQLHSYLSRSRSVSGLRLQDLDLRGSVGRELLEVPGPLTGLVVLGGHVPEATVCELIRRGAVVFPPDPLAPIDPYRARLYSARELYANFDSGYAETPDARAYAWSRDVAGSTDAYTTTLRALHDDAIRDALHEQLLGRRTVGVMGGHAMLRNSSAYRDIARLGHDLAERGFVVLTGGGPGAMEAANLGAIDRTDALDAALEIVARVPTFRPDIPAWVESGFEALAVLAPEQSDKPDDVETQDLRSVGIPTWFYGHEPPNVFGDVIAKYFSNALREDELLTVSRDAVIVLEGAAGTVQEIFQAATPMYYAPDGAHLPDLILVGRRQWSEVVPVWDALRALGDGRPMARHLHLVDSVDEALALVQL